MFSTRTFYTGVIVLVTAITIVLTIISLAAFQAFQRLSTTRVIAGVGYFTIYEVQDLVERIGQAQSQRLADLPAIGALRSQAAQYRADAEKVHHDMEQIELKADKEFEPIYAALSRATPFKPDFFLKKKLQTLRKALRDSDLPDKDRMLAQVDAFERQNTHFDELMRAEDSLLNLVQSRERAATALESKSGDILKGIAAQLDKNVDLKRAVNEALWLGMWVKYLLKIPFELAVLGIVLLSGALGSTTQIIGDFSRSGREQLNAYALRFLNGMLAALLLFIVVKAGVMFAVDAKSVGSSLADLNPFFIAFVGLVGGMISEHVVGGITRVAERWFASAESGRYRYALPAVAEFLNRNDDAARFAASIDLDLLVLQGMAKDDRPFAQDIQDRLALWLHKSIRELFSDLPAAKPSSAQSPAAAGPAADPDPPAAGTTAGGG